MYDHSPVGNYYYKRLTMVFSNYLDIFQQKMKYLFHGFEFICEWIYDLLILPKGDRTYQVHKLELTINRLK